MEYEETKEPLPLCLFSHVSHSSFSCCQRDLHLYVILLHNVMHWLLLSYRIKSKFTNLGPQSPLESDPCFLPTLISRHFPRAPASLRHSGLLGCTLCHHLWACVLPARNILLPTCMNFPFIQMSPPLGSLSSLLGMFISQASASEPSPRPAASSAASTWVVSGSVFPISL